MPIPAFSPRGRRCHQGKKALLAVLFFLAFSRAAFAQTLEWTNELRGWFAYEAVAADALGHTYAGGVSQFILPGIRDTGHFVRKFDARGNILWMKQPVPTTPGSIEHITALAASPSGNLAVSVGQVTCRVVRMDPDGDTALQFDVAEYCPAALGLDAAGNVYAAGTTGAPYTSEDRNVFVRKYNASGALVWSSEFGTANPDIAQGIAVDASGAVYVSGVTNGALAKSLSGIEDPFLRKFSPSGSVLWTRQISRTGYGQGLVFLDRATNDVYFGGYTDRTDAGYPNAFVERLTPNGEVVWTRQFSGQATSLSLAAVSDTGEIYVRADTNDIVSIRKYNSAAELVWTYVVSPVPELGPVAVRTMAAASPNRRITLAHTAGELGTWVRAISDTDVRNEYRIRVMGTSRLLYEDSTDRLISTRQTRDDSSARFIAEKLADGSYSLLLKSSNSVIREDEHDRLVSTRKQSADNHSRMLLEQQIDGSYRIRSLGSNRYWRVDANQLLSTASQIDDVWARFHLEPIADVTIQSSAPGIAITVDGQTSTAARTFSWTPGSRHSVSLTDPPNTGLPARRVFSNWTDGGAKSHDISAPPGTSVLTATFHNEYLLMLSAEPPNLGYVLASPISADGYYASDTDVELLPIPAGEGKFKAFQGAQDKIKFDDIVVMSGPASVTALFEEKCPHGPPWLYTPFAAAGGTGIFPVSAAAECNWTITGIPNWVTFRSASSGRGSATLEFSVARNPSTSSRSAELKIGNNSVYLFQDGREDSGPDLPLRFVPLTPCRLVETRPEYNFEGRTGVFGPPAIRSFETRRIIPANSRICSVPAGAKAFVLNFTVVPKVLNASSQIQAGQQYHPLPVVISNGSPSANSVILKAGPDSGFDVVGVGANDTNLIIDITGYFTDDFGPSTLVYYPITPCRAVDTRELYRPQVGPFGPPSIAAREKRTFHLPSAPGCSLPGDASAYALNLTVVPRPTLAYLTAWPSGGPQPNVSSVNSMNGQTATNSVIIPAGNDGSVDVFAYDQTDLLIDVTGYFAPDDGRTGLSYYTVSPCFVLSTIDLYKPLPFGAPALNEGEVRTIPVPLATTCDASGPNAGAFSATFFALPYLGQPMPFLTAWPTGQPRPNVSQLNAFDGTPRINSAIIPAGAQNKINVFVYRKTDLLLYMNGYFGR